MKFKPALQEAVLLSRYKRFLADVRLPSGEEETLHCPNTGSMKNCIQVSAPCWFSVSDNPKRKYRGTWEIATSPAGDLVGVNTARANHLVREAIESGLVKSLQGYDSLRAEVKYGSENSRIDFLLSYGASLCYVEVKNCTLLEEDGIGYFPDSVSARGTKHLRELIAMVAEGHRAVLFFCVQHTGIDRVAAAAHIDSLYAQTLKEAVAAGVEVLAYRARLSADEIVLDCPLPFVEAVE